MARNTKPEAVEPEVETADAVETADDGLTPVRTTFNPHEVIRVGAAELLDLERQGLIYTDDDLAEPTEEEGEVVESGIVTDSGNQPPASGKTEGGEGE